jgi:NADPH-ferrihemoprotein reductase
MDSDIQSLSALPQSLQLISKLLRPTSVADIVALILFASATAAYLLRGIAWDRPDPYQHVYFERPQQQSGPGSNQLQATRNIAEKLEESVKRAVIFWGSQSGTAERFASQLAKECQLRFGLSTMTADLSDYDAESIALLPRSKLAIFILATYGEGDPSDNASGFWEWINKAQDVSLSSLQYVAFGLGNSNYKYYNRVVDVVVESLNRLGATLLLPVGKADDAERATTEDFLSWKDGLFHMFRQDLHLEERPVEYQPTIAVVEDESLEPIDLHHGEPAHSRDNPKAPAACSPIQALSVRNPRELFTSVERNCVHMELDLSDHPEIHYKTGDHLAVWPTNPDGEVECILTALGLLQRREVPISLKVLDPSIKLKLPTPTTPSALFRYYLEICAPLSRDTILGLAQFASTPEAKTYILKLAHDKQSYADFLTHTHLTFGRLLSLASPNQPWSDLPLAYVIEALPTLQPRYYSISSSSVLSPRRPAITALVSTETLSGIPAQKIHGLTSNYLLALSQSLTTSHPHPHGLTYDLAGPAASLQDTKLFAHIRKSKFKLPVLSSCPIIMVAAGTGLAPFRAFIAERVKLHSIGRPVGEMVLFFGCRNPEEDFIYRDELEKMQSSVDGVMRVVTAFSRVPGQEKIYVQDRVGAHGGDVIRLIEAGASFYICGRASMAREVGKRVGGTVQKIKGWSDSEVKEWSEGLKRKGKWREDVWG